MIEGSETMSGSGGAVIARYNQEVVTPTWSITSGGSFATIDANGALTFSQSGDITIEATYNGYVATKDIHVEYIANSTTRTIVDDDGSITTITETTVENQDGSTTTSQTSTTTNVDGSFSQTESTTIDNADGSSTT